MPISPRSELSAAATCVAGLVLALGCARAPAPRSERPAPLDVVLITIDTLRADALGFAGNRAVETPTLDRLAAAGTVFTRAHAHNVVTLASHADILTGLYPFQNGIRDNSGFVLDAGLPTLATLLHDAGYATGAFVGAFPLDRRFGLARGFDLYDDSYPMGSEGARFEIPERRGDVVVAAALSWWAAHAATPRFLWAHLYDPHAAYDPPEPFASRYARAPYLGEVAAVDSFLAPLLVPHLDGRERPALVVVTGDHGESLGEHGELTHGLFAYEATLHVPLVVWGAGVPERRDDRLARHVDILPTILGRLGLEPPVRLPGRSLLAPPAPVESYFESLSTALNRGWAPLRGTIRGNDKYVDLPAAELYDLTTDPREERNLAADRPDVARELRAGLPAASGWPIRNRAAPTSEEVARLRSLGYAAGATPAKAEFGADDDPKRLVRVDQGLHEVVDLYSRGRFVEAVARARQVIALRPDLGEAYDHLALSLRQLEREDEAIAALRDGIAHAAVKEDLIRQLGMTLVEAGRAAEAVTALAPLRESKDPEALRALGGALSAAGDQEGAIAILERAELLAPGDAKLLEALGVAELRRDRVGEAVDLLNRALARAPGLATGWNSLGVAKFRGGDAAGALTAWKRAFELDSHLFDALYNLGLVAGNTGDFRTARAAFERYLAVAPKNRFAAERAKVRAMLDGLAPR